jgi:hypothetical protein
MPCKPSPSQAPRLRATQGFPLRVWPGPAGSRRNQTGRRCDDQPWWFVERASALCVAAQTPMEMSLCAPRFEVAALAEFALPRPLFRRPRREARAAGLDGSQPHASRRLVARSPPVHRGDGRHRGAVRLARCRAHRRRASRPRPARTPLRVAASLTWIAPNAVRDTATLPPRGRFVLRAGVFGRQARLEVRQGGVGRGPARGPGWRPVGPSRWAPTGWRGSTR